jgi:hypothetical protein
MPDLVIAAPLFDKSGITAFGVAIMVTMMKVVRSALIFRHDEARISSRQRDVSQAWNASGQATPTNRLQPRSNFGC